MSWKLLTTREFCETYPELNLTVRAIDDKIKKGLWPVTRIGGRYKLWPAEIRSLLIRQNTDNPKAIALINSIFDRKIQGQTEQDRL